MYKSITLKGRRKEGRMVEERKSKSGSKREKQRKR